MKVLKGSSSTSDYIKTKYRFNKDGRISNPLQPAKLIALINHSRPL